jgi:hypothetical protein
VCIASSLPFSLYSPTPYHQLKEEKMGSGKRDEHEEKRRGEEGRRGER